MTQPTGCTALCPIAALLRPMIHTAMHPTASHSTTVLLLLYCTLPYPTALYCRALLYCTALLYPAPLYYCAIRITTAVPYCFYCALLRCTLVPYPSFLAVLLCPTVLHPAASRSTGCTAVPRCAAFCSIPHYWLYCCALTCCRALPYRTPLALLLYPAVLPCPAAALP